MGWKKFHCDLSTFQLKGTLNGGQSFRWRQNTCGQWIGVFNNTVWGVKHSENMFYYNVYGTTLTCEQVADVPYASNGFISEPSEHITDETSICPEIYEHLILEYFRLGIDLKSLYEQWSKADSLFKMAAGQCHGIRLLNQDPVETLFSFICSANNNIKRISGMVDKLCIEYGKYICDVEGTKYYTFPTVDVLADPKVEGVLRKLSFGYRAQYIQQSARKIVELGGAPWLKRLQEMEYPEAKKQLMQLPGVGPKVADCICLMSLGHLGAIPVDTHVYQIASNNYLSHLKGKKSVTDRIYKEIGDHFRNMYGDEAGWAQTVLFCADLKMFGTEKKNNSVDTKLAKKRKKQQSNL